MRLRDCWRTNIRLKMDEEREKTEENNLEGNIKKTENGEGQIESRVEENRIEDSKIEGSEIKDSKIEDSKIIDSNIEDSKIKESEIIEKEIKHVHIDEGRLIEERKEKILNFFKNKQIWVLGVLIIAVILGVYIRSMPMHDHGGNPGLWDITTNTWTLGPDLDPWIFTRYAKIIVEEGSLPKMDVMRNVPLGFNTGWETNLLPYMIAGTYYFLNIFGESSVIYAATIFPVIMFALTIIVFFLFVREIFVRKSKKSMTKANIIALISSFFMIVIPAFLPRTIAGIPEKESAAFFFMFLAFYLFLKAWKSNTLKKAVIFGVLAGISTALMGLISGLVVYIFVTVAIASLIAFILNKAHKKEFIIYLLWLFFSFTLILLFSNRFSLKGLISSSDTGLAFLVFFIFLIHFIIWNTKLSQIKFFKETKIPKNLVSLSLGIILAIILVSVFFGPGFIIEKIKAINQAIFTPTTGRWNITVAENRQPYFTEWGASFGPFLKNIPILFWLFFIGSVVLFKKMLNKIKKKDSWILTGLYILFFFGLVFSRYSSSSMFNGVNFISKAFYGISVLLFIGVFIYYYTKYSKERNREFEKINYGFFLLFALFFLCLFTARGAVRLIMVLAPIAPIFVGYLIVECIEKFREVKDETWKIIFGVVVIVILLASIFTFWTFYKTTKAQAYNFVPSPYNQQWQKAMQWVRENTDEPVITEERYEGPVFGHWWDYGYWVLSIGNRATILDGANARGFWNYWMGRFVLTGDNQKDALEFLYAHNATHFLIDSSDIGKYGAFSSIGSNEDYDRYSWIGTFVLDEKQTQETKNQTIFIYSGGVALDEDLIINESGKQVLLPNQGAGIGAIVLPTEKEENIVDTFAQPYILAVYQGRQYKINLRYLSVYGKFFDFGSGIKACAYIFPNIIQQGQGINSNPIGAAMLISPRLMRGMFSQVYLLNDPLNNFPNFKLVYTEPNLMINSLRGQGIDLPEFVYYQGIQGPIKIWEIEYTGDEEIVEKYLDTDASKYINWSL